MLAFVVIFDVGTYSYYRGSVVTPFHGGPVSPTKHHLTLSQAELLPDGGVRFHVYLDAGTPEAPAHVVAADLLDGEQAPGRAIGTQPYCPNCRRSDFANDYAYNKFEPGPFGIRAPNGRRGDGDIARARFRYNRRCEIHTADGCGRPDLLRDTRK